MILSVKNLSKKYGNKTVLKNINLEFEAGKIYGIVGKNGAGKTTLFKSLTSLESANGKIDSPLGNLKNHIGLLETNPLFLSRITGWEYLKLLCVARGINEDNFDKQNIFDLPLNEYVEFYSTGMKKKLAFMAILLQKNDILILDEPFNGVDIQSNIILSSLIEQLKQKNKTILISSHIFSTLSNLCDQILYLKNGQIVKSVLPQDYKTLEDEMKTDVLMNTSKEIML